MGRAVNRSREGEKREQDFNLANSLSPFGFGKDATCSQPVFSLCGREAALGYSHFHYVLN